MLVFSSMRINPLKYFPEGVKTIIIGVSAVYLNFALILYKVWDSTPPGIIGTLLTSVIAMIDSLVGLGVWLIVIAFNVWAALRFRIIDPMANTPKGTIGILFLGFIGLAGDGVVGGFINGVFETLFGEGFGKIILIVIILITAYLAVGNLFIQFKKFFYYLKSIKDKVLKKIGAKTAITKLKQTDKNENEEKSSPLKSKHKLPLQKYSKEYQGPDFDLLDGTQNYNTEDSRPKMSANELEGAILDSVNEKVSIDKRTTGPMATTFHVILKSHTKNSTLAGAKDNIERLTGTENLRFTGNIKGEKNTVGIEVPNEDRRFFKIKEVLTHPEYLEGKHMLPLALGFNIEGKFVCKDLSEFPHLLVAGSTGSGKSIALRSMILSLVYKMKPKELGLVFIDPKGTELTLFEGLPHLHGNVATDEDEAAFLLDGLIEEMQLRNERIKKAKAGNIRSYNSKVEKKDNMPYMVVFIDEFAELIESKHKGKEVEQKIGRLAQAARSVGIHIVMATQKPSADVVKGRIKSNFVARLAFRVPAWQDSRTIITKSGPGAETLLGKGDCLLETSQSNDLTRIQSPLTDDHEVTNLIKAIS